MGLRPYFNATFREIHYKGHWAETLENLRTELEKEKVKPDILYCSG
jgi:hypothetical protein